MGSMDEVDTAYMSQRIAHLESKQQLHADLYMIERSSGKRWFALCGIFQVLWLLACSALIVIIFSKISTIPEINDKLENLRVSSIVPVGTIRAWLPEDSPLPKGDYPLVFVR